jgi:hypothetical protein
MDTKYLAAILEEVGMKSIKSSYFGRYSVWLENKDQKSGLTKAFIKSIWFIGKVVTKVLPFESKLLSPYIVLEARK